MRITSGKAYETIFTSVDFFSISPVPCEKIFPILLICIFWLRQRASFRPDFLALFYFIYKICAHLPVGWVNIFFYSLLPPFLFYVYIYLFFFFCFFQERRYPRELVESTRTWLKFDNLVYRYMICGEPEL